MTALCSGLQIGGWGLQKWSENRGSRLVNSCIVGFWGCFEKGCGSRKDRFYYF
jgi:hypothetical protein